MDYELRVAHSFPARVSSIDFAADFMRRFAEKLRSKLLAMDFAEEVTVLAGAPHWREDEAGIRTIMLVDFALARERSEGLSPEEAIYQACSGSGQS